jgi:hypothetical protein
MLLSGIGTVPKRSEFDPNTRHVITSNESNSNKLLKMEAKSTAERWVHQRDIRLHRTNHAKDWQNGPYLDLVSSWRHESSYSEPKVLDSGDWTVWHSGYLWHPLNEVTLASETVWRRWRKEKPQTQTGIEPRSSCRPAVSHLHRLSYPACFAIWSTPFECEISGLTAMLMKIIVLLDFTTSTGSYRRFG